MPNSEASIRKRLLEMDEGLFHFYLQKTCQQIGRLRAEIKELWLFSQRPARWKKLRRIKQLEYTYKLIMEVYLERQDA